MCIPAKELRLVGVFCGRVVTDASKFICPPSLEIDLFLHSSSINATGVYMHAQL